MAANAIDLCLASTVASDLGIAADATVQRCVTSASRAIASYCGRTFEKATGIVEYPDSYGRPYLSLERFPVLGITSISEFGATVDASEYESVGKNAAAGLVYRKGGRTWRRTARDTHEITPRYEPTQGETGSYGITVTYDAGYVTPGQDVLGTFTGVTVPEDLQEAAALTAVAFYRRLGRDPNIASESIGDYSVSFSGGNTAIGRGGGGGIPDAALQLLAPYARVPVL